MLSKQLKNLSSLNHLYSKGEEVFYASLVQNYEWFDKEFSIDEIVEPTKFKISTHYLFPAHIETSDIIIKHRINLPSINKKYDLIIEFDSGYKINLLVYELKNYEIVLVCENSKLISYDIDEIKEEFMKMVINVKKELLNDQNEETKIKFDEHYEKFEEIFVKAIELYPEEII